jgi:Ras-related protein Rab-7A
MQNFNTAANEYFFKVVLIGAPSVGKTSILERFVTSVYTEEYKATIGADFRTKELVVNNQTVLLQIWDTAGQERFRSLAAPFYRGAQICVLVFDVNDKHTFDAVEQWRDEFLHHADIEDQDSFPFLLLGNKCDLGGKVSEHTVTQWLEQRNYKNVQYLETSAKHNTNIAAAFDLVAKLCLQNTAQESLYVPPEASHRMDSMAREHETESINLEEAMSTADDMSGSSMCGDYYCQLL